MLSTHMYMLYVLNIPT